MKKTLVLLLISMVVLVPASTLAENVGEMAETVVEVVVEALNIGNPLTHISDICAKRREIHERLPGVQIPGFCNLEILDEPVIKLELDTASTTLATTTSMTVEVATTTDISIATTTIETTSTSTPENILYEDTSETLELIDEIEEVEIVASTTEPEIEVEIEVEVETEEEVETPAEEIIEEPITESVEEPAEPAPEI